MKKLFTLFAICFSLGLAAQPVNDDCSGLIDLGVVPFCPDTTFFTNFEATESDIGNDNIPAPGACGNNDITTVANDVWFAFTTSDTITDYTITVTGMDDGTGTDPMMNPQILIYRGDCSFDNLALLACGSANDGLTELELDVLDLDPNELYFIRITSYSSTADPNTGTFQLCIDEIDPVNTIDQTGSNACTGELYDSGGPDMDYGPNENNVFSICPPIGTNGCINFDLQYYNLEIFDNFGGNGDIINFYDGPDNSSPLITQITGSEFVPAGPNWGGVCYSVQASSGCLTVEMITDGDVSFEGFAASWECSTMPCEQDQPITVTSNITEQEIIDNISTPQTLVEIDTIICDSLAYGVFEAPENNDLGLERGLLLTSGSAVDAIGPNDGFDDSNFTGSGGDPDLDYLSQQGNGSLSNDACIVELDVFVATDELTFEYVFGSEEYSNFVNSSFNDIFAFFISGPGITGDPNIDNQENIAVLPGTTTPVEINSVNNAQNWEYYRDNTNGQSADYSGLTSDFLGVKKSLTARAEVIPCNTYHLKLAVADRGDTALDSGVFISEIKGGTPNLTVNFASGVDYLVENCTGINDELVISLTNPLDEAATYDVTIEGTAQQGVDYILEIPSQVTIAPGETELTFPLIPLADALIEGTETIIITLSNNFGCGDINLTSVSINITDNPLVEIITGEDTVFVCSGNCVDLEVNGAADYFWEPVSLVDDPFSPTPEACPTTSQMIYVTGTIGSLPGCSNVDSVFLQIIDPEIEIVALDTVDFCVGDSVQLQAVNNVNGTGLLWSPPGSLSSIVDEIVTATPSVTTEYVASVTVAGCTVFDSITVNIDPYDFPEITTLDTIICQGQSVDLASDIEFTSTTYEWTPDTELTPSNTVSGPVATPEDDIIYTLIATSPNGYCADTVSVNIEVVPAEIEVMPEDTVFLCLGETAELTAMSTTNIIAWTPEEGLDNTSGTAVMATPDVSTWYFATTVIGACTVVDSVFVRVDSLPDVTITAVPDSDPYCPGEIVSLISPTYEPMEYPDIEHLWEPTTGAQSDPDNWNLVISATETTTYTRTTTNNACSTTSSITINVVDLGPQATWTDTTVCPGTDLQIELLNGDNPMWSPSTGLSCDDCTNPTISVDGPITYTVSYELDGCSIDEIITINVDGVIAVQDDATICVGESIILNSAGQVNPNADYSWTSSPNDPTLDTDAAQPEVSPTQTTMYTVTVDNGLCPPFETSFTITVINDPQMTVSPDQTICTGETVLLEADVTESGGTFNWAPIGSSESSISVSPNSTQTYTVTYDYGCGVLTESITVTVNQANVADIAGDTNICIGDDIQLNSASINSSTYTWTSNPNDPTLLDPNDPEPTVSPTQTTTYTLTVENNSCPNIEEEFTVFVISDPTVTINPVFDLCEGESTDLEAIVNEPGGTYAWSNGEDTPTISITPDDTTTYTVDYITACGTVSDEVTVNVIPGSSVEIVLLPDTLSQFEIPEGEVVNLVAELQDTLPGASFDWSDNQAGQSISAAILEDGFYSVTVTTVDGCEYIDSIEIRIIPTEWDVPNAFTPDGDNINDFFYPVFKGQATIQNFQIYNRWGNLVYDNEDPDNGWDGTKDGDPLPSDVYVYKIQAVSPSGRQFNQAGDVTLIR